MAELTGDIGQDADLAYEIAMEDHMVAINFCYALSQRYGPQKLETFVQMWCLKALGIPGVSAPAEVELIFLNAVTGEQLDLELQSRAVVWAGRWAAAWVAGDADMLEALRQVPADDYEQLVRAVDSLTGLYYVVNGKDVGDE